MLSLPGCGEDGTETAAPLAEEQAPGGGVVHIVRLTAGGARPAFEPAEVTLRPGDLLRFVQTARLPESVAFDTSGVPPGGAELLAEQGALSSSVLLEPGAMHDVSFEGAPAGRYPFFSLPHAALGMEGVVTVQGAESGG